LVWAFFATWLCIWRRRKEKGSTYRYLGRKKRKMIKSMIKQIEVIRLHKDIQFLTKHYFHNNTSMAKALDVLPKVLRDFTKKGVMPQDKRFEKMIKQVEAIKLEIKEAKKYKPEDFFIEND
tara:strand:+ start:195 stop:557 length:363 start_codon:yes stop_codon:yes gene_type:complete